MPVIRLTLSDESYAKLQALAGNQSIQDYIRSKVFGESIFTVDEAVRRIQAGNFDDKTLYPNGFELPDVFGEDWTISKGPAGSLGKQFYRHTKDHPELGIKFKDMGPYGRRAVYTYTRMEEDN